MSCIQEETPAAFYNILMLILIVLLFSVTLFTMYVFFRPYIVKVAVRIMQFREKLREKPIIKPSLIELKISNDSKLDKLEKQIGKVDVVLLTTQLDEIVRSFLQSAFDLSKKHTFEELINISTEQKMPRILKIALVNYLKEIVEIEYSKRKLEKDELTERITKAREIFDLVCKNLPQEEVEAKGKKRAESKIVVEIYKQAVEVKRHLVRHQIKEAAQIYNRLLSLYKELPDHERKRVYSLIEDLKHQIEAAMKGEKNIPK